VDVIKDIMVSTKKQETQLRTLISGKKKNNLPTNYKLATLYFDRKMLSVAEKSLIRCSELASTLVELQATRRHAALVMQTTRECDSRSSSRRNSMPDDRGSTQQGRYDPSDLIEAEEKLLGIKEDLRHVREISAVFGTLTPEVQILPCLLSRFTDNVCDCEDWWKAIRSSPLLVWNE
jgi:hypothetical protein